MPHPLDLIIDCDPGIDDALALFLAAGSAAELNLLGVTCVAGNRPVPTTAANARRLLDAAGCPEVPVYAGAARPLSGGEPKCNLVHGEGGLGGVVLPQSREPEAGHAVDQLVHLLLARPAGSVTLVAIGPLTNLALAERRHPGVLRRARQVLVMGGAVACAGNITPHAEFNFYADPDAAQAVLSAGAELVLFGLDVTSKAVMSDEWIASLADLPGRSALAAHDMLRAYAAMDPLLHDACPIAFMLRPELFRGEGWMLGVDCSTGPQSGQVRGEPSTALPREGASVQVIFDVDRDGLLTLVRESLSRLP